MLEAGGFIDAKGTIYQLKAKKEKHQFQHARRDSELLLRHTGNVAFLLLCRPSKYPDSGVVCEILQIACRHAKPAHVLMPHIQTRIRIKGLEIINFPAHCLAFKAPTVTSNETKGLLFIASDMGEYSKMCSTVYITRFYLH